MEYNFFATCASGLEATVKRELNRIGYKTTGGIDGRVEFTGSQQAFADANLWLRSADRVFVKVGVFSCETFDELFNGTAALPWADWITVDGKFDVIGKSRKSKLFSVSDCQAIVKRAVAAKLQRSYGVESRLEETGAEYKIQVSILDDTATLALDTSGAGLNKRGYREETYTAPIKETLAAALIDLSYWRKDRTLLDPFCGSGTIAIEAAMIARNIAPGLTRGFASEKWGFIDKQVWRNARLRAMDAADVSAKPEIHAYDIDPNAAALSTRNAEKAGVGDCITVKNIAFADVTLDGLSGYGSLITNPPYGERMGDLAEIRLLYKHLRKLQYSDRTWSFYVITSDEEFEKHFGIKAHARRKLYSGGNIKTDYYQFHGLKPKG
jgi:putative N6-adenine-specific DNA methylase